MHDTCSERSNKSRAVAIQGTRTRVILILGIVNLGARRCARQSRVAHARRAWTNAVHDTRRGTVPEAGTVRVFISLASGLERAFRHPTLVPGERVRDFRQRRSPHHARPGGRRSPCLRGPRHDISDSHAREPRTPHGLVGKRTGTDPGTAERALQGRNGPQKPSRGVKTRANRPQNLPKLPLHAVRKRAVQDSKAKNPRTCANRRRATQAKSRNAGLAENLISSGTIGVEDREGKEPRDQRRKTRKRAGGTGIGGSPARPGGKDREGKEPRDQPRKTRKTRKRMINKYPPRMNLVK